jgi:mycothiol synthase
VTWQYRHPSLRDVAEILAVVGASDEALTGEPDWTAEEVTEILIAPGHDPERDSWLVAGADGRATGWAYLHNPQRAAREDLGIYVVPGVAESALRPLLDLAVARTAERAREFGHPAMTLRAAANVDETAYLEVLRDAGFVFVRRHARMRRVLSAPLPDAVPLPDGYEIRPVREEDLPRFHEVLRTAFADTREPMPVDHDVWRRSVAGEPKDDWFAALAGGELVGVLESSRQWHERGEGWVRNLAVLRGHRRSGLGAALLHTAFARYAVNGLSTAGLGVDMSNPTSPHRLYAAAGMTPVFEADVLDRIVPAVDGSPAGSFTPSTDAS